MKYLVFILVLSLMVFGCSEVKEKTSLNHPSVATGITDAAKPAFVGDEKAVALANEVLNASGGQRGWDQTNYLQWNFFGSRKHIWNKSTGDLIIKGIRDTFETRMNLKDLTGTVNLKGEELTHPDSLEKYILKARDMWRNDSYWVFLPFKLKDAGVTLSHLGTADLDSIIGCQKLQMTFESVGKTPENKYVLWVHPTAKHIIQWDFYPKADDEEPRFSTPWTNYQKFENISLSDQRGPNYLISEIEVGEQLARHFK